MKLKTLTEAYSLLSLPEQKRGFVVVLLLVLQSLLDFFGIAFFLPLIFLIVNPELISTNRYLKGLYDAIGFSSPVSFIIFIAVAVLVFTIVKNVISVWIAKVKAHFAFGTGVHLSAQVMEWYVAKSYEDFTKADFSKELMRIADYPIMFANNILLPLATLLSESLVVLLIMAGMAFYDLKILIFLGIILLPVSLLYQYHKRSLKKIRGVLKEQYPLSLKYVLQVAEGLVEIKVAGKESFFKERLKGVNRQLARAFANDHTIQNSTIRITEVIAALMVCSIILYAVTTQQNYQQTILLLGIYASASFRIIPSVNRILSGSLQIRLHEYLVKDLKVILREKPEPITIEPEPLSFQEKIELRNISVQYPDGPSVLQNTSIVLHKGERIAITGRSGEGKTTLLLVLLGVLKNTDGEMLVDGHRVKNEMSLRKLMGYVPQNPYILDDTIARNIAFGTPAHEVDRGKILRIIEDLDLHALIDQMPDGLDTRIGEHGVKLSGGQRQRLAVARALYHDAEILLLDEVTNQLDQQTQTEVMNTLMSLSSQHKTVVFVTHRPELRNAFDTCYELKKGKLEKLIPDRELNPFTR